MVYRTAALSVARRPGQAFLIGIAVVAAAAFAAASLLLALNARDALVAFGVTTPPAVDAVVVPSAELETAAVADIAEKLRALPGTSEVAVQYYGDVEVEIGGTTSTWKLSSDPGSGPLSEIPELTSGNPPGTGEVVLGASTADRAGASVGDSFVVEGRELVVAGIGPVHEFGQDTALVSEEDAVALGETMMPVQIFVTGDPDLDAMKSVAGENIVLSGEERRAAQERTVTETSTGVFGALAVFVALALVSAVVIVSSTFRIMLSRRATELALLRCIGATRNQVSRLVLIEAACIGLLGGIAGVAIGLGVSAALVAAARGAGLLNAPFISSPIGLVACVALAVLCTIVAALPAARAAGSASPVEALGASRSSEARPLRRRARSALAGALAVAAIATGAVGLFVSSTDQFVGLAFAALSGLLVFGALVATGPFLVSGAAALLHPLASRSVPIRLALSNTRRASRRTAAMTTVLTLGVGLTAALVVGVAGATQDAQDGVARNFPSTAIIPVDLVADPEAVATELSAHPDVEAHIDGLDILIDPAPGSSDEDLRAAVLESTDPGTSIFWADDVLQGIEQMILIGQAVGAAMIGVTMLVALIGVAVTLALSVTERRQEIALLRALGVSRSGARRSIAAEAALASLVGAVTGVAFGSAYGVLALRILGLSAGPPPLAALAALVVGVTAAALIAAAVPMWNAARVQPAIGVAAR
ncbi:FtsX-like permease family protein [Brachybacterium sp. FME24]|uniref:FtsX-like permease family protein n=1 Tax=Brachybacterium sp. FME24 TaxID=2742605 RepID=UPI00186835A7|nr:ABC transporter permease [Brachybacterium sp. FME24]